MLLKSYQNVLIEAGCDEAGRGCLAGPVFAAAVIFSEKTEHDLINDSKKLNAKSREYLKCWIEDNALDFAIASVDAGEIDKINIHNASYLAMHKALDQLALLKEILNTFQLRRHPFWLKLAETNLCCICMINFLYMGGMKIRVIPR